MKANLIRMIAALFCLCAASCSTSRAPKNEPEKVVVEGPKLVGRIASVPADKRFVLIQSYGKWECETGQILTTRGPDERTANLRITGEKLGEFAAADVQSGRAELGDAVYLQHVPKPVTIPTPSEAATLPQADAPGESSEAASGNVQKNN